MSRVDLLAQQALANGSIRVDLPSGAVYYRSGTRAEQLDKRLGYGRVCVYNRPFTLAMAHRVVWIAAYGLIPYGLQINHINRHRWDNELDNLELVSPSGNMRHWRDRIQHDAIGTSDYAIDPSWLDRLSAARCTDRRAYAETPERCPPDPPPGHCGSCPPTCQAC